MRRIIDYYETLETRYPELLINKHTDKTAPPEADLDDLSEVDDD